MLTMKKHYDLTLAATPQLHLNTLKYWTHSKIYNDSEVKKQGFDAVDSEETLQSNEKSSVDWTEIKWKETDWYLG